MNFNQITLIGRLTGDPEKQVTNSGKEFVRFTIAVNRDYKDETGTASTDFIPCVAFGKLGEIIAQYGQKGRLVLVQGSLETRKAEDKNGSKHTYFTVFVDTFKFLKPNEKQRLEQRQTGARELVNALERGEITPDDLDAETKQKLIKLLGLSE